MAHYETYRILSQLLTCTKEAFQIHFTNFCDYFISIRVA